MGIRDARRGFSAGLMALGLALCAGPALAERDAPPPTDDRLDVRAQWVVTWLAFPVIRGTFTSTAGSGRYRASFKMRSLGLVDLVMKLRFSGEARGELRDGYLAPQFFRMRYRDRKEKRVITLKWRPSGEVDTTITPPEHHSKRKKVPKAMQHNTIDPVTALMTAAAQPVDGPPCRHKARIFEGRRRVDTTLKLVRKRLRSVPWVKGATKELFQCHLHAKRLAGFRPRHMRRFPDPLPPADIWYVRIPERGLWLPVHIRFRTRWGTVGAWVRSLEIK